MKTLLEIYVSFFRIGMFAFGGGYSMLPLVRSEVVQKRHWETDEEVLDCYAIGQCAPGAIAVNTATFIGYQKARVPGALAAALGVITPSFLIILLIASVLRNFQEMAVVQHALAGVRAGVCALVLKTVVRMGRRNLINLFSVALFAAVFIAATLLPISPVFPILGAALAGLLYYGPFGGKMPEAKTVEVGDDE